MSDTVRFPYVPGDPRIGAASRWPLLPLTLEREGQTVKAHGLVDSGASVNVLPFGLGQSLGLVWEEQHVPITLTGNLAHVAARGVVLTGVVDRFEPVRLAFAWTQLDTIPVILGQTNFFDEFDICFFRTESVFEVRRRGSS